MDFLSDWRDYIFVFHQVLSRLAKLKEIASKDYVWATGLVLLVLAVFWKTVFIGLPLSKICRLAEWDSLFSAYSSGVNSSTDPSLVLLLIPYYFLVAKSWHSGQLPLWNPHSEFGLPLIADPQAAVFNPLHLLFLAVCPSMRAYNLILVAQVAVGAVGMFGLCRCLKLRHSSAILSAVTFSLCPYFLWFCEQDGSEYFLMPGLLWLFARAALKPDSRAAAGAGVGIAVVLLSGHPELAFFSICFSSLFFVLSLLNAERGQADYYPATLTARLSLAIRTLAVMAAVSFCLSAPMLLPFLEYLTHADCYKYGVGAPAYVPWHTLILNMTNPACGAASPFLGVLALLSLPLAALSKRRQLALNLLVAAVVSFAIAAKQWPLSIVLQQKPFCYIIVNYSFPMGLLFLALLAALGFEEVLENLRIGTNRAWMTLLVMAGAVLITPPILMMARLQLNFADFDSTVAHSQFTWGIWRTQAVLVIGCIGLLASRRRWPDHFRFVTVVGLLLLQFVSLMVIAKNSMPLQPAFEYHVVEPLALLQSSSERTLATGNHLFRPNTNLSYGISDVRCHNVLHPLRYLNFVQACGAQIDDFNQVFDSPLSKLLDIAGVKYVLSQSPVIEQGEIHANELKTVVSESTAQIVAPGITLRTAASTVDLKDPQVRGLLQFSVTDSRASNFTYSLVVLDGGGHIQWFSDQYSFVPDNTSLEPRESLQVKRYFTVPIPLSSLDNPARMLGLQVFDRAHGRFLIPRQKGMVTFGPVFVLCDISGTAKAPFKVTKTGASMPHFKLVSQTKNQIRLYENTKAVPLCYVARDVVAVTSGKEALSAMRSSAFSPGASVVVEAQPNLISAVVHNGFQAPRDQGTCTFRRDGPNMVKIQTILRSPALVVLNDVYYPGWQATIDGKQVPILRANYLFRAVAAPAGVHAIEFTYKPVSFILGVMLALACMIAVVLIGLFGGFSAPVRKPT